MAFSLIKFLKGLKISQENTTTPASIIITPAGSASTTTTVQASQTADRTLTLPDATDTLVGKATTDVFTNKSIDASTNTVTVTATGVTATTLNAALTEMKAFSQADADDLAAHLSNTIDAHDASAISVVATGNLTSTNVQSALEEMQTEIDASATDTDLSNHIANTSTHGVTGNIVGTGGVQTLTDKSLTSPILTGTIDASTATTANVATSNVASTVNIGTGSGVNSIIIGGPGSTITLQGTTITETTTNLSVTDKLITINKNGGATTAGGTGLEIEEDAAITGYMKTTGDRSGFEFKAPSTAGISTLNPGASNDEIALLAKTQTLSNKIIDATANTLSNISNTSISATAAIDFSKLAALSIGKALQSNATTGVIEASAVTNTELGYVAGATSSLQTQLDNQATSLATKASLTGTEVLTNKDYDGGTASNTSRITLPKAAKTVLDGLTRKAGTVVFDTTSNKPYYDDGTQLQLVGSGSGGGAANFITNGNAETGVVGWSTYKDAAASRPVDGTGGVAAAVAFTRSTTAPLIGDASFLFTKSAVNGQGEGASFDFTINAEDKAKVLTISMSNLVDSGTFVAGTSTSDSDVIVYLYDITNAVLIEPSSFKFLSNSTTISDKFQASFQTASNSTSYRLILHCATTSAVAYALKLDSISVSPSVYVFGSPVSDYPSYVATTQGLGVTPTVIGSRVGSYYMAEVRFTLGTTTASEARISLPPGLVVSSNLGANTLVGKITLNSLNSANDDYSVLAVAGNNYLTFGNNGAANSGLTNIAGTAFPSSIAASLFFKVPIAGWSSSVQTSDQTDTRIVAAAYKGVSSTSVTGGTAPTFTNKIYDTHSAYTSNAFVAPVPGYYRVTLSGQYAGSNFSDITIRVANSIRAYIGTITTARGSVSGTVYANAGETIAAVFETSGTVTDAVNINLFIERISGPSAIAATEEISASYSTSNVTVTNGNSNITKIPFTSKIVDTHGAYNTTTGDYTCPAAGRYEVQVNTYCAPASGNWTTTIFQNSTQRSYGPVVTSATPNQAPTFALLNCLAGDVINVRGSQNSGTGDCTFGLSSAFRDQFTIKRVK